MSDDHPAVIDYRVGLVERAVQDIAGQSVQNDRGHGRPYLGNRAWAPTAEPDEQVGQGWSHSDCGLGRSGGD
jgi:hypothetical protein